MERQKSFSIKSSRLLLFSTFISSFLLLSLLFFSWPLTTSPPPSPLVQVQVPVQLHLTSNPNASSSSSPSNPSLNVSLENSYKSEESVSSSGEAEFPDMDITFTSNMSRSEGFHEVTVVSNGSSSDSFKKIIASTVVMDEKKVHRKCDILHGRWVFDESRHWYTNNSCPYIDEGFSCETNGRLDRDYMKWRWQPYGCNIPRFDPVRMLQMLRGKRLVFVGDSINRNQWESLLCMLKGAIKDPKRISGRRIRKDLGNYNFKFLDYHCSVEFYVSHFLVQESKARVGKRRVKTLKIDMIDRSSSRWRNADILVFNTAHWWSHYKTQAGVNYYQEGDQVHPRLNVLTAFRRALKTWSLWVDQNVNRDRTHVFFRTSSPSHFRGGEWNSGGHCMESKHPLNHTFGRPYSQKNMIVEEIVKQMKTPVTILNITSLSGLRIDGHPSIYGEKPGKGTRSNVQDCSHWCLPGVPDTWNELLYYHLQSMLDPVSAN